MNRLPRVRLAAGLAICGLAALMGCAAATAQNAPAGALGFPPGYLGAAGIPDERTFLPPPPANNSIAGRADLATFRSTRVLAGTARWDMAAHDAITSPQSLLADFSCALGVTLTLADTPALSKLSTRTMSDAVRIVGLAKDRYQRPRPFLRAKGPICIATDDLVRSGSYPSGHATAGWLYALILAELAPSHASEVLARGRAYGESRVVCGVHYVSDVEGGRTAAGALFAPLHSSPDFQADITAARAELSALQAAKPGSVDPKACAAENAELFKSPW
jgi:acid phosphatase (class A)